MDSEILFEQRGAAGIVTLNRPKALNALTHAMALALARQLDLWAEDPAVRCIVVQGAGERAFCAGGDIRRLYDLAQAGRFDEQLAFWHDEYLLNARIKTYPKPYVALVDGIVMGGGVGVSIHGSHCVAGDRFQFAMPEVGIGFFPDVGATYALPRLPGEVGTYCALTGARLNQADAADLGLVRAAVRSADFPALVADLAAGQDADAAVAARALPPAAGPLRDHPPADRRLLCRRQRRGDSRPARWRRGAGARACRHHPQQIADEPQDRARPDAARADPRRLPRRSAPSSASCRASPTATISTRACAR